jgi:hypothetical protein
MNIGSPIAHAVRLFYALVKLASESYENMARPLPLELAGALYHVTTRGNERRAIFSATPVMTALPSWMSPPLLGTSMC